MSNFPLNHLTKVIKLHLYSLILLKYMSKSIRNALFNSSCLQDSKELIKHAKFQIQNF